MSERSDIVPTPEGEYIEPTRFAPLSFLLALLALATLAIKTFLEWKQARAYALAERAPQEGILPLGAKPEDG